MSAPHPASPEARDRLVLGVVGGSGLYEIEGLTEVEKVALETPFGRPSDAYTVGVLPREGGLPPVRAVFLPRHGRGHVLLPSEINFRANVHGFKQLGVTHLVSVSAVGSLREDIAPGHVVAPDQFIDRTNGRAQTFFGGGLVAHVQMGDPVDAGLRERLLRAAEAEGARIHARGTCVVMEGPAFSTRAESNLYRAWGADVIGMTALPEAKLAREAEIAYALLAMATDYDCWHQSEEEVSVEAVVAVLKANAALSRRIVRRVAAALPLTTAELPYPQALTHALITDPTKVPAETRRRLDLIAGHLLPPA
ncbi:S-methyl-5'-thioadenosine phosphorylase [Nannocystis sp. SCPEA4]|uniref:S-methyl-5'-thioadenosine phosphorylase n=1 Tax=Nannocystis sp. SCPEA4 TaxID=2996787 RepID=UPI002271F00B|nr:S-methyl-5'-thioadenosine phosphorylase [Nannocystis sp. SCPEA4]MCY1058607.1 S-methyl-5'-thioadenosine phosphorylase [Nannocystis sp. SCPEA4]